MTDYSKLAKRLRITPAVSNETLAARIAMDEAADAIDTLQARVAELEALVYLADAALMQSHGCFPLDRNTDEQRFLNDVAKALRAVTGKEYEERKARTAQASALLERNS